MTQKEAKYVLNAVMIMLIFASIISLTMTHTEHYTVYLFFMAITWLLKLLNSFR